MYQGLNTYATEWDGTMMPFKIAPPPGKQAGQKNSYWFGAQLLASEYGKNSGLASGDDGTARDRAYTYMMAYVLQCPSNPPFPGDGKLPDGTPVGYSYNGNFGDSSNSSNLQKNPYKKMSFIPRTTLVSSENHPWTERGDHDYYFKSITDLFKLDGQAPSVGGSYGASPQMGHPHSGDKKGNMLFADGQIVLDDPFKLNTTDGVQLPVNAPNSATGTDYLWIPNPFTGQGGSDPTRSFPF
jgi:prepilin-type processing-associated H-X9-DG protein